MTNEEIIKEFEFYLVNEKRRTNNTLYNYQKDLKQFMDFIGNKSLQEVTPKDIKLYIMNLVSVDQVSAATQNRKIATLRTFFGKFMVRENLIEVSPTALIDSAEVPESIPEPVELSDIEKMVEAASSFRDKLLLELLYATGARRFELAKMKFSDINLASKQVKIVGKKNKTRFVPLHGIVIEMLMHWKKENTNDYIFPGRDGKSPLSTRSVNHIVNSIKEKAGLGEKNITPHKFRHSFCSHLWESGADILTVKDLAGHAKTDTTLVYTKTSTKRNRAEYEQYHPRAQQSKQQESLQQ